MAQNKSLSILEVISKSSNFLEKKGVPNHKTDAEWLIAHALGCKRMDLYLRFGEILDESILGKIRALVVKRGERIPLQHILGSVHFAGLQLKCDDRALVPRHETEFLVDYVSQRITTSFSGKIADVGCGGGAIILALCNQLPDAVGVGFDKSDFALGLAKENCHSSGLSSRVSLQNFDWLENDFLPESFDLIISNPPYLSKEEWLSTEPEVKSYDPIAALVAQQNGLSDIRKIVSIAQNSLRKGGYLALEFGHKQAEHLEELLAKEFVFEIIRDQLLVRRFVFATKI
jgi:release factor glutamine methyltransferase